MGMTSCLTDRGSLCSLSQLEVTFGIFLSVHVFGREKSKKRKTRKVKKSKSRKVDVSFTFRVFCRLLFRKKIEK